jgi:hypothetical protein
LSIRSHPNARRHQARRAPHAERFGDPDAKIIAVLEDRVPFALALLQDANGAHDGRIFGGGQRTPVDRVGLQKDVVFVLLHRA